MTLTTGELALAAAGFTLVGTALGGLITFVVTDRQVRSAAAEGEKQRTHDAEQRKLEREHERVMRDEERRAAAYAPLLKLFGEWSFYAGRLAGFLETGTGERPAVPSAPVDESLIDSGLFASPELTHATAQMAIL